MHTRKRQNVPATKSSIFHTRINIYHQNPEQVISGGKDTGKTPIDNFVPAKRSLTEMEEALLSKEDFQKYIKELQEKTKALAHKLQDMTPLNARLLDVKNKKRFWLNTVTDINNTLGPASYGNGVATFCEDARKTVQTTRNYQLYLMETDPGDETETKFELVLRRTEAFTLDTQPNARQSYSGHRTSRMDVCTATFSYHNVEKHIFSVSVNSHSQPITGDFEQHGAAKMESAAKYATFEGHGYASLVMHTLFLMAARSYVPIIMISAAPATANFLAKNYMQHRVKILEYENPEDPQEDSRATVTIHGVKMPNPYLQSGYFFCNKKAFQDYVNAVKLTQCLNKLAAGLFDSEPVTFDWEEMQEDGTAKKSKWTSSKQQLKDQIESMLNRHDDNWFTYETSISTKIRTLFANMREAKEKKEQWQKKGTARDRIDCDDPGELTAKPEKMPFNVCRKLIDLKI